MKYTHKLKVAGLALLAFSGLATAQNYTPAQMQQLQQMQQMQEMIRQRMGLSPTPAAEPVNQAPAATETEVTLAEKLNAFPAKTADIKFEDRKDGFSVNGQPFMDAEGRISKYAFDVMTADVTYLVQTKDNSYTIKYVRAGSTMESINIGFASSGTNGWQVQTVTGKKLAGELLTVLPKGVLISRDAAAFKYTPGTGVNNIAIPQGYITAPFQHGNVGATDFVLLEKVEDKESATGGLFSSLKAMGNVLGINKKEDYALLSIKDGKMHLLNIAANGKDVKSYSNCRKENNFVNKCDSMTSQEALYEKNGDRNTRHYYWRTNWFNTTAGPIAIAMENGVSDVTITDLTSGKKVVGFNRGMGILKFDANQDASGKVKVVAQLGFETQTIEDALVFLQTTPEVKVEEEKVSQTSN